MKRGILRTLGVIVTLALMLVVFPASVASAALWDVNVENVEGNEDSNPYWHLAKGEIGDKINIFGDCTSTADDIYLFFSSQEAAAGDSIGDAYDDVSVWSFLGSTNYNDVTQSFTLLSANIPDVLDCDTISTADDEAVHDGLYYIYVCVYDPTTYTLSTIRAGTQFVVVGNSSIELDDDEGVVGTEITITGEGYAAGEYINILFDNDDITNDIVIIDGDDETDSDGSFEITFEIPETTHGDHTISVVGEESSAENSVIFTIIPSIKINPSSGQAGSTIIVSGTGFDRRGDVDIFIGGIQVDDDNNDRADIYGSFTYSVVVPSTLGTGSHTILAEDEEDDDIAAQATFTVSLNSILTLSTNTGNVGDTVTVSGSNFTPSTNVVVMFDNSPRGTFTTDASGNFTADIQIPSAPCGAHKIKVGAVEQTYTITPKMTLDKIQGIAGTTVTVTGNGFAAGTAITAKFNGAAIVLTSAVTDATGSFTTSFVVPAVATGTYVVEIAAGNALTANFTIVDASITLDKNSGEVGDTITVTGINFGSSKAITLTIDGVAVAVTPTPLASSATGGFTASFNIPIIAGGLHTLSVTDGTTTKTAQFTVTAKASLDVVTGPVGQSVTVTGSGFTANSPLTITFNGVSVVTGSLTANGYFNNATFTVPASGGGAKTVVVSDGTNSKQLTFTMETTAPTKPALTLPLSASKEKGVVTFDWTDSTDASMPVTYTLQIATDSGFTSLALTKAGLTASTYTLTEAETLPKLPDGGSYYWKVIAKDAANNSVNSDVNTFVVGGGMPGWLMWVWIGIGVVVVFVFAIWLGRRLAYSSY